MNFYAHARDQRLANKGHQLAYASGYVCFMRSDIEGDWEQRYLEANSVDNPIFMPVSLCLCTLLKRTKLGRHTEIIDEVQKTPVPYSL